MIWTRVIRARKGHRCSRCSAHIEPRDLYKRTTISPHDNDVGNEVWWTLASCVQCLMEET